MRLNRMVAVALGLCVALAALTIPAPDAGRALADTGDAIRDALDPKLKD